MLVWNPPPLLPPCSSPTFLCHSFPCLHLSFHYSPPFLFHSFARPSPPLLFLFLTPQSIYLVWKRCKLLSGCGRSPGAKWMLLHFQLKNLSPLVTAKLFYVRFCICKHCGPHSPFGVPVWYLSGTRSGGMVSSRIKRCRYDIYRSVSLPTLVHTISENVFLNKHNTI